MVNAIFFIVCVLLCANSVSPINLRKRNRMFEKNLDEVRTGSFKVASPFAPTLTSSPTEISKLSAVEIIREGLSGAFAGSIQVILLMWLRTTMSYQHKYGLSLMNALRDLHKQGGIRRFYKGIEFAIIQAPLAKFFSVASNDVTMSLSNMRRGDSAMHVMLFTALGGIISSFFRAMLMPIDTCKTVLQVDGAAGFQRLKDKVLAGHLSALYQGTLATIVATFIGHYPWYTVHNYLQGVITQPSTLQLKILKNAFIAFVATAVSDIFSNSVRVVKTVKQTSNQLSYTGAVRNILSNDGYRGLFGRGMMTRLVSNSIQSIVFTVIWKLTSLRHE